QRADRELLESITDRDVAKGLPFDFLEIGSDLSLHLPVPVADQQRVRFPDVVLNSASRGGVDDLNGAWVGVAIADRAKRERTAGRLNDAAFALHDVARRGNDRLSAKDACRIDLHARHRGHWVIREMQELGVPWEILGIRAADEV